MVKQKKYDDLVNVWRTRSQVEKAGERLRRDDGLEDIKIIQAYRTMHQYALGKDSEWVRRNSLKVSELAIVVSRLKRLPTILDKIRRPTLDGQTPNTINISQMQDIAGCRVILDSIEQVQKLQSKLQELKSKNELIRVRDYIKTPKTTGYRGVHLIFRSGGLRYEKHPVDGFLVEIQIRAKLQHAWPTTVEIIDLINKGSLKTTNQTDKDIKHRNWQEFFILLSKCFAKLEQNEAITIQGENDLRTTSDELGIIQTLKAFNAAVSNEKIREHMMTAAFALLTVEFSATEKPSILRGEATFFQKERPALTEYARLENEISNRLLLLVETKDMNNLDKAYPNYSGNIDEFLKAFALATFS